MRSRWIGALMAVALTAAMSSPAFAGAWQQNGQMWWYDNGDGTWPENSWRWIDGNGDGIAECYHFDATGYLSMNEDVDGYRVNGDGAWIVDGLVQTRTVGVRPDSGQEQTEQAAQSAESAKNTQTVGDIHMFEDGEYTMLDVYHSYASFINFLSVRWGKLTLTNDYSTNIYLYSYQGVTDVWGTPADKYVADALDANGDRQILLLAADDKVYSYSESGGAEETHLLLENITEHPEVWERVNYRREE